MNKVFLALKNPYPLEERKLAQIKLAFIFALVVFSILYFVKPFGFSGNHTQLLINSIYAGVLTFVAICFNFLILFPVFPLYFREESWTIGREIIFTLLIITTIATFNVVAGKFIWGFSLSILSWVKMIFLTGLIGIGPAVLSILLNQARLLKKYRREINAINEHLPSNELTADKILEENHTLKKEILVLEEVNNAGGIEKEMIQFPKEITFTTENEKEHFTIAAHSFLAATSADNYVKIFYISNDTFKTAIIRTTLKKAEENTSGYTNIFRSHRTALVNLEQVKKVNGTAQGYKLKLAFMSEDIPVSRNLNKELKERLSNLTMVSSTRPEKEDLKTF